MKQTTTNGNGGREHADFEERFRTLMCQDEKARAEKDKLAAKLATVEEEIARIAAEKLEVMSQLNGLYKKAAGQRVRG